MARLQISLIRPRLWGGDEDRAGLAHHLLDALGGLLAEVGVAHGQDLVDEEDSGRTAEATEKPRRAFMPLE